MRAKKHGIPAFYARWHVENVLVIPLVVVIVWVAGFWALVSDRQPPVELVGGVIAPLKAAPGESITTTWRVRSLRKEVCEATLTRSIVDSQHIVWRIDTSHLQAMPDNGVLARTVSVPFGIAWGPASYRLNSCYQCSGFSLTETFPICRTWPDLSFEIVPPKQ